MIRVRVPPKAFSHAAASELHQYDDIAEVPIFVSDTAEKSSRAVTGASHLIDADAKNHQWPNR